MNLEYITVAACAALVAAALLGSNSSLGSALSGALANIGNAASCALTPELNPQLCKENHRDQRPR